MTHRTPEDMSRLWTEEQRERNELAEQELERLQAQVSRSRQAISAYQAVARGDKLPRCPKTGAVIRPKG